MTQIIAANTILARNSDQLYTQVDEEIVMLNVKKSEYYGLNSVGSDIWNILNKPMKLVEIIDYLEARYDIQRSICEEETRLFVVNMLETGVIHILKS